MVYEEGSKVAGGWESVLWRKEFRKTLGHRQILDGTRGGGKVRHRKNIS